MSFKDLCNLIPKKKLDHGSHDDPNQGVCLMEAVAFIAGEEHTDNPKCACPVLTEKAIEFNDSVNDKERQRAIPAIPFLVGSATGSKKLMFKRARLAMQLVLQYAAKYANNANDTLLSKLATQAFKDLASREVLTRQAAEELETLLSNEEAGELVTFDDYDVWDLQEALSQLTTHWDSKNGVDHNVYESVMNLMTHNNVEDFPTALTAVASVRAS